MATKTDWEARVRSVLSTAGFNSEGDHTVMYLLREFAAEATEMADSHGDFVVGRKIRDMLPPKKEG